MLHAVSHSTVLAGCSAVISEVWHGAPRLACQRLENGPLLLQPARLDLHPPACSPLTPRSSQGAMSAAPTLTMWKSTGYELIERYDPWILWSDIGYPPGYDLPKLFAHFYNRQPEGLVNDRWMQLTEFNFSAAGQAGLEELIQRMKGGELPPSRTATLSLPNMPPGPHHVSQRGNQPGHRQLFRTVTTRLRTSRTIKKPTSWIPCWRTSSARTGTSF